jgi:general secretion pathway protein I
LPFTRARPSSDQSGFTLLEVLVAFAVLAVMIVPILQVFGGGLGSAETARAYSTAVLLARSKLAEVGAGEILTEGEITGSFEVPGFRWRRTITRDTTQVIPPDPDELDAWARVATSGAAKQRGAIADQRQDRFGRDGSGRRQSGAPQTDELIPYEVTVTVEWNGFRGAGALTLSTLRLAGQANVQ